MDFICLSTAGPNKDVAKRKICQDSLKKGSFKSNIANFKPAETDHVIEEPTSKRNRSSLTPQPPDNKTSRPNLNNTDEDLLQDSFTIFEDTQALIDKSNKPSGSKSYLSFTQMCSDTQIMKKIDDDINNSNKRIETDSDFQQLDDSFLQTSYDLSVPKSTETKNEVAQNFSTSQYKKDIETLFNKVEYSICEPGPNQDQTLAKNDDNFDDIQTKFAENIYSAINWDEESWFSNVVLSQEKTQMFGSVIKNALLKNAEKSIIPGKIVNQTLPPTQVVYRELGKFYGLPKKVEDLFKLYRGIDKLYDWQDECLNLPAIKDKTNLVYALPTSGGKTLVAEVLILREILCWKRNALFILPYVAIVQEKVWGLSPFAVALNFLVEEYAAGKGKFPPRKRRRKNSVYVATIEKALGIVNSLIDTGRTDELGLVVIDELHLIGDQSRGATLEELLSKLLCIQENIQIIGMSATIGNLNEICKFLNAESYTQNFRPVELVEYVKCAIFGKIKKIDPDFLGGMVMEVVPNDSCLIFCSSKKNCENVATLLCRVLPVSLKDVKINEKADLKKALEEETGNLCNILKVSLQFGVAYHHSGLTADERRLIEDAFRAKTLLVICCTSTLAAGVNLPTKRVILRQPYIGRDFINLSRYKQMVGRAGRAGLGDAGESITICTIQDLPKIKELLLSPMDEALSSMYQNGAIGMRQLLLSLISLNIATTRIELHKMARKTLLAVQESRLGVKLKKIIDNAIVELFKLGAIKVEDNCSQESVRSEEDISVRFSSSYSTQFSTNSEELPGYKKSKIQISLNNKSKLVISKLGSAAIRGGLELSKAHLLYEDLLQAQASLVLLNCLHLLFLVTPYEMSEQVRPSKPRYYRIYTQMSKDELQTAKILGLTESIAVRLLNNQPIKTVSDNVLNRFYVTLMLYDLWNGVTIFQVAEKFEQQRGFVQNLMTSASSFAANVVNFCSELEEFWSFAYLLRGMSERLQHCCVKELLPLMDLPSVKQTRARQLYDAGYKSLLLIAKANPNDLIDLIDFMTHRGANQLIAAAKLLLLEKVENLKEEAEDIIDGVEPNLLNETVMK
ncbi:putative dna polymerase theta [Holotrichia oblita]|uniref:Dna polymerase theta n=1 Tax=Holotrichia oblita TaxID=644536 RepID=A0ACB9SWJ2_HOLOL|nr:putative dna polymerase theta [Holotrichia oblita]